MEIIVDSSDCVYTDSQDQRFLAWIQNGYHFRVRQVEDLLELTAPVMKIAGCRMDGIAEAARPVMEKYGGKLKVTLSGSQWLDTMERSVNKGAAVKILQDGLMIRPEETVVFGDQMNDVEMLKQAYYSFAVANASRRRSRRPGFWRTAMKIWARLRSCGCFYKREDGLI